MSFILTAFVSTFMVLSASASDLNTGDIVYANNGNHLVAKIERIFDNKIAEIRLILLNGQTPDSDGTYFWNCKKLSKASICTDGICTGDIVYGNNGSPLVGEVKRTFENSKVEIEWISRRGKPVNFNRLYYWDSEKLALESSGPCSSCN